jgi:hypothetical protein
LPSIVQTAPSSPLTRIRRQVWPPGDPDNFC